MTDRYGDALATLRVAYDGAVEERAGGGIAPWKDAEQRAFLDVLRDAGATSLLEIGAGTGRHGQWLAAQGLDVLCTDASPAMVEHCRSLGLAAEVCDFLSLRRLGRLFDAVFAMNCLLHVPRESLVDVLGAVRSVLVDGGHFFLGQYGGVAHDGVFEDDSYEPKRYFSWLPDDDLRAAVSEVFEVVSFRTVDIDSPDGAHFQSLVLRA